jgi:hypothetical protein
VPGGNESGKIRYVLRVVGEGTQPQDGMKKKLDLLQHSFKQLEQ